MPQVPALTYYVLVQALGPAWYKARFRSGLGYLHSSYALRQTSPKQAPQEMTGLS